MVIPLVNNMLTSAVPCFYSSIITSNTNSVITVPLKWQKKIAENLRKKQKDDTRSQSQQGNIKVFIIITIPVIVSAKGEFPSIELHHFLQRFLT